MLFTARLLITLFLGLILFITVPVSAHAQEVHSLPTNTNSDVPHNLHTWTQSVTIDVMSAMVCQLMGFDPVTKDHKCLGLDTTTGKVGYVEGQGGAIGFMGTMIAALYTPPLHFHTYTNYLAQNFGISKPAYAQQAKDLGFEGLKPLFTLWKAMLNVMYVVVIIAFIVIGMGIMLRIHISPQAVMSVENQIPQIVLALILSTFSYAIAAIIIDLMYVAIFVVFNLMISTNVVNAIPRTEDQEAYRVKVLQTQRNFNGENAFGIFNNLIGFREIVTDASGGVKDIVTGLFTEKEKKDNGQIPVISGILDFWDSARNVGGYALGLLFGLLALLIIGFALLWAMFQIWFTMLRAYIFFLFDVMLAPLWIIIGIFPGSGLNFSSWIRDMLANLSCFVVVIGLFLVGNLLNFAFRVPSHELFVPPLIGNPNVPNALGSLIGLGIILITPQAMTMTKELFKAPQFKYTASIGQAIGAGQSMGGKLTGGVWKRLWKVDTNGNAKGPLSTWASTAKYYGLGKIIRGIAGVNRK